VGGNNGHHEKNPKAIAETKSPGLIENALKMSLPQPDPALEQLGKACEAPCG
jgi:hypothetical protein